jgi:hypothetical protein
MHPRKHLFVEPVRGEGCHLNKATWVLWCKGTPEKPTKMPIPWINMMRVTTAFFVAVFTGVKEAVEIRVRILLDVC